MFEIHVLTLFPEFFKSPLQESILKRAQKESKVKVQIHNLRDFTHDKHKTADDKPFGGGAGMVMKPEPIVECLESVNSGKSRGWVVLLGPQGETFSQSTAVKLSKKKKVVLIAGHYEGVDHRVREHWVDEEISAGDYITMGGEAPALCMIEAVVRLVPGVLGNHESLESESFCSGLLEYPQYTRPREYRGYKVPDILASGHHEEVKKWREKKAKEWTREKRPDLYEEWLKKQQSLKAEKKNHKPLKNVKGEIK